MLPVFLGDADDGRNDDYLHLRCQINRYGFGHTFRITIARIVVTQASQSQASLAFPPAPVAAPKVFVVGLSKLTSILL